jgi:hypothetical protein
MRFSTNLNELPDDNCLPILEIFAHLFSTPHRLSLLDRKEGLQIAFLGVRKVHVVEQRNDLYHVVVNTEFGGARLERVFRIRLWASGRFSITLLASNS